MQILDIFTAYTKLVLCCLCALASLLLSGCRHIQLVNSPLPITLNEHTTNNSSPLSQNNKPKPSQKIDKKNTTTVYLLEDWF